MESNPHGWLSSCDKTSPVRSGVEEALPLFDMRSLATDLPKELMKAFMLHILCIHIFTYARFKKTGISKLKSNNLNCKSCQSAWMSEER